ncbi:hypothetical protein PoB_003769600 [Plakobranchus ocellatus]|uniref:Uncharacterized protein n=1 Tax=Plakobranchus ocellatus TaxID=259542 RepID=A0AAV4AXD6_9GAST|nr:hypothetical protein PoB_003769600 [Plakobranchus ocellatus]
MSSQAFRAFVRPGRQWRGLSPRQKDLADLLATVPPEFSLHEVFLKCLYMPSVRQRLSFIHLEMKLKLPFPQCPEDDTMFEGVDLAPHYEEYN